LTRRQTGSGKTFTMMGTEENPGVNRRAVKELLRVCAERTDVDFKMTLSLMEIYNEKVIDLLSGNAGRDNCDIRMDPDTKLPFVDGLTRRQVSTVDDVVNTLAEGDSNRSVAATAMNAHSSRSHLLLQIVVSTFNKISGVSSTGKLTLVDLAGSERVSKSEATGQRLVEAAAINKSLSALGQVFTSLRTGQQHIPYRNSKLTHILQDSLGGDAKTCMFINASPAESNLAETLGTLQFGQVNDLRNSYSALIIENRIIRQKT
jgi:kinesin family member C2/C3